MNSHTPPSLTLYWHLQAVPFQPGETIAAALLRAGIVRLGDAAGGMQGRYFCGIGNCLVSVDGASAVEACLTPAQAGMRLTPALQAGSAPLDAA